MTDDRRGTGIRIGNAPVSWGVYEAGVATNPPYARVLDAIAEAGYDGTELGPFGYMPSDPAVLGKELGSRKLALGSSYVGLPLHEGSKRAASVEQAMKVARLLASQGVTQLMIAPPDSDVRARSCGRAPKDGSLGWSEAEWKEAVDTLHAVARAALKELGMTVVVHHHVATCIETPAEIDKLLARTDPELVSLLLDTGHAVYGGGDAVDLLTRHAKRVRYVHFKDVDAKVLEQVRTTTMEKDPAWKAGIFCALGEGVIDFPKLASILKAQDYSGWVIVEQDVIPDDDGKLVPEPFASAKKSRQFLRDAVGL